jgi:hypothetical protein
MMIIISMIIKYMIIRTTPTAMHAPRPPQVVIRRSDHQHGSLMDSYDGQINNSKNERTTRNDNENSDR